MQRSPYLQINNNLNDTIMATLVKENEPQYKAINNGFASLSTIELLSLIVGNKDVTTELADKINTLKDLANMQMQDLLQIPGIGKTKANKLLAVIELAKRLSITNHNDSERYDNAPAISDYMYEKIDYLDHEEAWVMCMNNSFKLIKAERISTGGLTETSFDIRQILRAALINKATVIAVAHNHPSGNLQPSKDDDNVTAKLKMAAQTMRIHLMDHLIISDSGYYSYYEEGKL